MTTISIEITILQLVASRGFFFIGDRAVNLSHVSARILFGVVFSCVNEEYPLKSSVSHNFWDMLESDIFCFFSSESHLARC